MTGAGVIQGNNPTPGPNGTTIKTIAAGALGLNDTFSGIIANGFGGTLAIVKVGNGTLTLSGANTYTGPTTVQHGTLLLANNGSQGAWTPVLTNGGHADVQGGRLIFAWSATAASPATQVESILSAGYTQSPKFSAGRILTTNPADSSKGLGWYQDIAAQQVIIGYTYFGDANLDGKVNALGFNALASNYGLNSGAFWYQGDFNYDGQVNTLDFDSVALNFNQVLLPSAPLPGAGLGALVPEPASLGLLSVAALASRRRRK